MPRPLRRPRPRALQPPVRERLSLSSAARTLDANTRTQGDFDAGKVRAMREAIEKGTFKINAGAIADKLLSNAQEVLSHARV